MRNGRSGSARKEKDGGEARPDMVPLQNGEERNGAGTPIDLRKDHYEGVSMEG